MIGRIFLAICAGILVVGIGLAVFGYTRGPEYDQETGTICFVVGIGMTLLGAVTTTLMAVMLVRMRGAKG